MSRNYCKSHLLRLRKSATLDISICATHCNTLHATHCITMQHTATHCTTLQHAHLFYTAQECHSRHINQRAPTYQNFREHPHLFSKKRRACCSVVQCVAVCCSVMQCVACSVLQCVAACCSVLYKRDVRVAVWYSALQCVAL